MLLEGCYWSFGFNSVYSTLCCASDAGSVVEVNDWTLYVS